MLNKGFIYKLMLLTAILFLFTIKPGGNIQIYYDYWGLNIVIIKNQYSLLLIRETLDALYSVKYFTKLNIIVAFN